MTTIEPFTQDEWDERKGYMECIDGMHEPPYDSDYDQMTVNVGEMLRLYATIDYLLNRPRLSQVIQQSVLEEVSVAPEVNYEERLVAVKAARRREGRCLLCGATRLGAGAGCYEIENIWMAHSWPEETPDDRSSWSAEDWRRIPQRLCTECGSVVVIAGVTKCLECAHG